MFLWSQRDWNQANRDEDGNLFHMYLQPFGLVQRCNHLTPLEDNRSSSRSLKHSNSQGPMVIIAIRIFQSSKVLICVFVRAAAKGCCKRPDSLLSFAQTRTNRQIRSGMKNLFTHTGHKYMVRRICPRIFSLRKH